MPTVTTSFQETTHANPLDVVESIAEVNEWVFDRRSDQEIAVQAPRHLVRLQPVLRLERRRRRHALHMRLRHAGAAGTPHAAL